jgi:hypothetical protein
VSWIHHQYLKLFILFVTMNGLRKQECFITLCWKGLSGQTVQIIRLIQQLQIKWSVVIMAPETLFAALHFICNGWAQEARVLHYTGQKGLPGTNIPHYLTHLYVMKKWSVVNRAPGTVFTALHFLHNLWMALISKFVTLHWAGLACHWRMLQVIGPFVIYKENEVL